MPNTVDWAAFVERVQSRNQVYECRAQIDGIGVLSSPIQAED